MACQEAEISSLQETLGLRRFLATLRPYVGSSHALRAPPAVALFWCKIFQELARAAALELAGARCKRLLVSPRMGPLPWCLGISMHVQCSGHLVYLPGAADMGMLFHAKEHPKEFTNRKGPVLPVCSQLAGGQRDPRRGTRLSIFQKGYEERNFLYLLSRNASFRVPVWPELLAPGCSRFYTVDERHFGLQLGTIYYLAHQHDPAMAFPTTASPRDILCVPCHFPADWHLKKALRLARQKALQGRQLREEEVSEEPRLS